MISFSQHLRAFVFETLDGRRVVRTWMSPNPWTETMRPPAECLIAGMGPCRLIGPAMEG
jgi:hypothetical protein